MAKGPEEFPLESGFEMDSKSGPDRIWTGDLVISESTEKYQSRALSTPLLKELNPKARRSMLSYRPMNFAFVFESRQSFF